MRKKVRPSSLPSFPAPPVQRATSGVREYPTLRQLFGATPEMRSWVAGRLTSMARHAAVASLAATALGCGHGDSAPPTPSATVTPVVEHSPPPPPTPAPENPVAAVDPPTLHEGDPCPLHDDGHVVSADTASKLTPHHRRRLHPLGVGNHNFAGGGGIMEADPNLGL